MKIPYYEKIHNEYQEGKISKAQLDELCKTDKKLKEWIEHYEVLNEAIKDLKKKEII